MNIRSRVTKEFNRRREDYRHHGIVETIGRANAAEFRQKQELSKRKTAVYLGAAALFGTLASRSEGVVYAGAIAGAAISGLSAWSNATKASIYGMGPEKWQAESARIRERSARSQTQSQSEKPGRTPGIFYFIKPEGQP